MNSAEAWCGGIVHRAQTAHCPLEELPHGVHVQVSSLVAAVTGTVLSCVLWQAYFDRLKDHGERHVSDLDGGRRLRLWAYAHAPLYMGIASLAAGAVALAAPGALGLLTASMYVGGLLLAGCGLVLLGHAVAKPAA